MCDGKENPRREPTRIQIALMIIARASRKARSGRRPRSIGYVLPAVLFFQIAGCDAMRGGGKTSPLPTEAILRSGEAVLHNVQITLHAPYDDDFRAVAFGVTDSRGQCRIVAMASLEALALPPGDYRCTLSSASETVKVPIEYTDVHSTPLTFTWEARDELLELEIPAD